MRMWMVNPKILCTKHLCGNHVECHMLLGSLKKKHNLDKFILTNLFEPMYLQKNHDELAEEMIRRKFNHKSELLFAQEYVEYIKEELLYRKINSELSLAKLLRRCPECRKRYMENQHET